MAHLVNTTDAPFTFNLGNSVKTKAQCLAAHAATVDGIATVLNTLTYWATSDVRRYKILRERDDTWRPIAAIHADSAAALADAIALLGTIPR